MKMSLDEEVDAIDQAERNYEILDSIGIERKQSESEIPLSLPQISGEFMILQHPYSHAINEMGGALQLYALEPPELKSGPDWPQFESNATEILEEGGGLTFDRRAADGGWIRHISRYIPENTTVQVSGRAWEARLIDYAKQIIPIVQKALTLEDDHPNVGMMHEELQNLGTFTQAYWIGKTKGIEELRKVAPALAQGQFLQY
tara:strand:- start:1445 stop:2050 length:606 start_codon:yes stop_codon:yes gene_type:complete